MAAMNACRLVATSLLAGLACTSAWSAGGHHAVDDASILEPGQCELEGWFERVSGSSRLLHAGANCRVGPAELGAASEVERQGGSSQTQWHLQAKWAHEVASGFSVGLSATPFWQARAQPRYQGTLVAALATWGVTDKVNLHANLGRDVLHGADDESRGGISIDWSFREGWQAIAERYRQEGGHFVRAGLRWEPARDWKVDFSRAHHLRGNGQSSWTLGLVREFGR
jgi:hypothetical protein